MRNHTVTCSLKQKFMMKLFKLLVCICCILLLNGEIAAQENDSSLVRTLDNLERMAILNKDTNSLAVLMSPNIVVHNPEHTIVGYRQIIERINKGKINYASFERNIEKVTFVNGLAILMGQEIIIPLGETKHAGKTIKRRFTNIWTKENGRWKLTVRQATIVSIE